ncbi:MAG: AtpZ/AtpI family protein [Anaerolineae bacterium]
MKLFIDSLALGFRLLATVLVAVLGPVLAGIWIDQRAGTAPWGVLAFMVLGILLSTLIVYRLVSVQFRGD